MKEQFAGMPNFILANIFSFKLRCLLLSRILLTVFLSRLREERKR